VSRPQEGANFVDRTGQRHGKLVVVRRIGSRPRQGNRAGTSKPRSAVVEWLCICDCGNETTATADVLRGGYATSCGCSNREPRPNYRLKNPLPPGRAARNRVLKQYRGAARHRGLAWELAGEEFDELTSKDCTYCGCPPSTVQRGDGRNSGEFVYNGIDRVDNALGYVIGNVVPCCPVCNHAKKDMSHGEFMAWVTRLTAFQAARRQAA